MHTIAQLQLANACHPSMSDADRRRIMMAVAVSSGNKKWQRRLRRLPSIERRHAMAMLDEYEQPELLPRAPFLHPTLLIALLLLLCLALFVRS